MRIASFALALLALACAAFSIWGLHTVAGRREFDEMAGILPFAAGVAAPVFALAALVAWWRHSVRGRRRDESGA